MFLKNLQFHFFMALYSEGYNNYPVNKYNIAIEIIFRTYLIY